MHRAFRTTAVLLGCLLAPACAGPRTGETGAAFAPRIEALNRQLEERFGAEDLLGVANLYADDVVLLNGTTRIEGREAVDAYWSELHDPVAWRLETSRIGGSGRLAYERGRSRLTQRRDGLEHTTVTEYLRIWRKADDGEWRIAVEASW